MKKLINIIKNYPENEDLFSNLLEPQQHMLLCKICMAVALLSPIGSFHSLDVKVIDIDMTVWGRKFHIGVEYKSKEGMYSDNYRVIVDGMILCVINWKEQTVSDHREETFEVFDYSI